MQPSSGNCACVLRTFSPDARSRSINDNGPFINHADSDAAHPRKGAVVTRGWEVYGRRR